MSLRFDLGRQAPRSEPVAKLSEPERLVASMVATALGMAANRVTVKRVAKALAKPTASAAARELARLVRLDADAAVVKDKLVASYVRAVRDGERTAVLGLNLAIGVPDEHAIRYARKRAGELVVEVNRDTHKAIRQIVADGIASGVGPPTVARQLRAQIGLHSRWATAVTKYENGLLANGASPAAAAKAAQRYRARLLKVRSENIARTEMMKATNEGSLLAWEQNRDRGVFGGAELRKVWHTAQHGRTNPNARVCDKCRPLHGAVVVGLETPFSKAGVVVPPAHPSCRCRVTLEVDESRARDSTVVKHGDPSRRGYRLLHPRGRFSPKPQRAKRGFKIKVGDRVETTSVTRSELTKTLNEMGAAMAADFGTTPPKFFVYTDGEEYRDGLSDAARRTDGPGVTDALPDARAFGKEVHLSPWTVRNLAELSYNDELTSPHDWRKVAHETAHTMSGAGEGRVRWNTGLQAIVEEGGAEIVSVDWATYNFGETLSGTKWDTVYTETDERTVNGVEAIIRGHAYSERVAEVIAQGVRRNGWDRDKVYADIAATFAGDTEARNRFFGAVADEETVRFRPEDPTWGPLMDSAPPEVRPVKFRSSDDPLWDTSRQRAATLLAWLVDHDPTPVAKHDHKAIDAAMTEWLDEVSFDEDPELGADGLAAVDPEPNDPDDDVPFAKHGDKGTPGYAALHPGSGLLGSGVFRRWVKDGPFDFKETVGPNDIGLPAHSAAAMTTKGSTQKSLRARLRRDPRLRAVLDGVSIEYVNATVRPMTQPPPTNPDDVHGDADPAWGEYATTLQYEGRRTWLRHRWDEAVGSQPRSEGRVVPGVSPPVWEELPDGSIDDDEREVKLAMLLRSQVDAWMRSAADSNPPSIRLQNAVSRFAERRRGKPTGELMADDVEPDPRLDPFVDLFVEAVYDETQEVLRDAGVSKLPIFRGMYFTPRGEYVEGVPEAPQWVFGEPDRDTSYTPDIKVELNPASSWAAVSNTAKLFANSNYDAAVRVLLKAEVPAEDVWSLATTGVGALDESEVVVLGFPLRPEVSWWQA